MRRIIESVMKPLQRRIQLMIGRAIINTINDTGTRQFVQITALKGEVKDHVEHPQEYGFASHSLKGAHATFFCIGGNRDHPIVSTIDDPRYRIKNLQPGEVGMYSHTGDSIILKNNNSVEINTKTLLVKASSKVRFETPQMECTGTIIDHVDDDGKTMHGMREIYNRHVHPENDSGGPTNQPIPGDQM